MECHYAECRVFYCYAECHYAVRRYVECRGTLNIDRKSLLEV